MVKRIHKHWWRLTSWELLMLPQIRCEIPSMNLEQTTLMLNLATNIVIGTLIVWMVIDFDLPSTQRTFGLHDMTAKYSDARAQEAGNLGAPPLLVLSKMLGQQAAIHCQQLLVVVDVVAAWHGLLGM